MVDNKWYSLEILEGLDKNESILENTEFLLGHGSLSKRSPNMKQIYDSYKDNLPNFAYDLVKGKLDNFLGSYVAYQKGILVGQSLDRNKLYTEASTYFGSSSLAVFRVPTDGGNEFNLEKLSAGKF